MNYPITKAEARNLLHTHVTDTYQRVHAEMVGAALLGYAKKYGEDEHLWWLTGYLHDIDYDKHPTEHPGPSLLWLQEWGFPPELIQAIKAHACGFNGFTQKPETLLDKTLIACDEICGIFYAYQKINPIPFKEMKPKSIQKRLNEPRFAPNIDRSHITDAVHNLDISINEHINNLIEYLSVLDTKHS